MVFLIFGRSINFDNEGHGGGGGTAYVFEKLFVLDANKGGFAPLMDDSVMRW